MSRPKPCGVRGKSHMACGAKEQNARKLQAPSGAVIHRPKPTAFGHPVASK